MLIRYVKMLILGFCISLSALYSGVFGCSGPAADTATNAFPETCAEAQENAVDDTGERPANGTYTLYVDGDEAQPWDAYCQDMNRAEPKEYLSVNEDNNISQISNGTLQASTSYRRYRIDPLTLEIDPLDTTFATNTFPEGFTPTLPGELTSIPAGWAEFQVAGFLEMPVAATTQVNLADTGFKFATSINADGYFCDAGTEIPDEFKTTTAVVAEDLISFTLSATTIYSENGGTVREVADCTNLGPDAVSFETGVAVWPLAYVGE